MEQPPKPAETTQPKSKKTMYGIVGAVVIIIVVVLALLLTGVIPGLTGKAAQISIEDNSVCASGAATCKFNPASYSGHVGDTVTWKNNGGTTHTVTFPDPTRTSTSGGPTSDQTVAAGQTVSVTFSKAGTFNYYCTIHTWMKANVTVT